MKIIVTGSAGFLGSRIYTLLKEFGQEVVGIDLTKPLKSKNYSDIQIPKFTHGVMLKQIVDIKPDVVIHAGAQLYGVLGFHENGGDILMYDTMTSIEVIEACRKINALLVFISSSMVYERTEVFPTPEDEFWNCKAPLTGYGMSKYVSEMMIYESFKQHQLPRHIVWRPFNIIDPEEINTIKANDRGYSHVFSDFFRDIIMMNLPTIEILGDGEQVRCFSYAGDIARMIVNAVFIPSSYNKVYNIGSEDQITMKNLAILIDSLGIKHEIRKNPLKFKYLDVPKTDVKFRVPDLTLVRKTFGFIPTIKIENIINLMITKYIKENNV